MKSALLIFLFLPFLVQARPVVQNVRTLFENSTFITELKFSEPIAQDALSVDFINETVQVNVPGASVRDGKILNRVRKNGVKSVYTYQFQPGIMRVRLIYDGIKAAQFKEGVKLESSGQTLRVITQMPLAKQNVAVEKLKIQPQAVQVKTEPVEKIAPKPVKTEDLAFNIKPMVVESPEKPVEVAKADPAPTQAANEAEENIPLNLEAAAAGVKEPKSIKTLVVSLLALLLFSMIGFLYLKFYQGSGKLKNKHTSIKMLTQHHLGPKKSLAIVQVAGESILIGVTDHNISMIKSLSLLEEEVPEVTTAPFDNLIEEEPEAPAAVYQRSAVPQSFESEAADEPEEDFAFSSIRDQVKTRLQNYREIR